MATQTALILDFVRFYHENGSRSDEFDVGLTLTTRKCAAQTNHKIRSILGLCVDMNERISYKTNVTIYSSIL